MYDLVYDYPDTMPEEDYFPDTKKIVNNYNKSQRQDLSQNIGLDSVTNIHNIIIYI